MQVNNVCNNMNNVNNTRNTQTPNFKAKYIFQLPKTTAIFEEPENLEKCYDAFFEKINEIMKINKSNKIIGVILQRFPKLAQIFKTKVAYHFEKPSYTITTSAKKRYEVDLDTYWIFQAIGQKTPDALKEGYHSFYCFTGKDADIIIKADKKINKQLKKSMITALKKLQKSDLEYAKSNLVIRNANDPDRVAYWKKLAVEACAESGCVGDKYIQQRGGYNIDSKNIFEVNSWDDLSEFVKKLDLKK